jgi:hypothetical protein
MKKLSLLSVFMLLTACGGGGGGGASITPTTPTYSYISVDNLADSGGSPNKILGRATMWRSNKDCYSPECSSNAYSWLSKTTNGVSVTYSAPDSTGVQRMTIGLTDTFNGMASDDTDIYLNYETSFTNEDASSIWNGDNFTYGDLEYMSWLSPKEGEFRLTTIGFVGDAEPASYVAQAMVIASYWFDCTSWRADCNFLGIDYKDKTRDLWVFVIGDPTNTGDMPSTGSANYNVIGQMFMQGHGPSGNYPTAYYVQGDGSFSANFSARTLSGSMLWDDVNGCCGGGLDSDVANITFGTTTFDGSISGNEFSGDVSWEINDSDYTDRGTFAGGFFGPNASDIGGTFYIAHRDLYEIGIYYVGSGSFTGCKTC